MHFTLVFMLTVLDRGGSTFIFYTCYKFRLLRQRHILPSETDETDSESPRSLHSLLTLFLFHIAPDFRMEQRSGGGRKRGRLRSCACMQGLSYEPRR